MSFGSSSAHQQSIRYWILFLQSIISFIIKGFLVSLEVLEKMAWFGNFPTFICSWIWKQSKQLIGGWISAECWVRLERLSTCQSSKINIVVGSRHVSVFRSIFCFVYCKSTVVFWLFLKCQWCFKVQNMDSKRKSSSIFQQMSQNNTNIKIQTKCISFIGIRN